MEINVQTIDPIVNVAESLKDDVLDTIYRECYRQYENDLQSRSSWQDKNDELIKLALQVVEEKHFPWPNASNVKYPLLTVSAMQFHARAQERLLQGTRIVKAKVVGKDPNGEKAKRANRISEYMSYQLYNDIPGWMDQMDRALLIVALTGMTFKKTYYSYKNQKPCSEHITSDNLIFSYWASDWDACTKTERIPMVKNDIITYMRGGYYLDYEDDLLAPTAYRNADNQKVSDEVHGTNPPPSETNDTPYTVLEMHINYDIDGDGYAEPWIITIIEDINKVVRISPRFTQESVVVRERDGKVVSARGINMYTRYIFMPDPQSPLYGIGLGHIIGPLNKAVNSVVNQLIDSGTLNNLPSGFLGRGFKLTRGGPLRFAPGEWKTANTTGDDMRKSVFPMPIKEPSTVLYTLLAFLVGAGEKVGSVADIMLGENPGQNQPYSTTAAVLEQGQKVFVSIFKRLYRSFTNELNKLYQLDYFHLDPEHYSTILDNPEANKDMDFDLESYDICPKADPEAVSDIEHIKKSEVNLNLAATGMIPNRARVVRDYLEAINAEDIDELMQEPEPQPPKEIVLENVRFENRMKELQFIHQVDAEGKQASAIKDISQAIKNFAAAKAQGDQIEMQRYEKQVSELSSVLDRFQQERESRIQAYDAVTKRISAENAGQNREGSE